MEVQKGQIYFCSISSTFFAVPSVYKLLNVLNSCGIKVRYLHWRRSTDEKSSRSDNVSSEQICAISVRGSKTLLIGYLCWCVRLFLFAMRHGKKQDLFFVRRIDGGLPIFLASKFKRFKYVYLDEDAAFMSYSAPKPLLMCVKWLEKRVALSALLHFIPGESRNFTKAENVRVVPNAPAESELVHAQEIGSTIVEASKLFTIYINGWLVELRGMKFIFNVLKKLPNSSFRVLVAGELASPTAEQLIQLPVVTYLGVLTNAEALSVYYQSDIVLSFYDPSLKINQVAEPNKWLDCVCTGTQFITNHGISTAEPYVQSGACVQIDYNDEDGLYHLLCEMSNKEHTQENNYQPRKALLQLASPWDLRVKKILEEHTIANELLINAENRLSSYLNSELIQEIE